MAPSNRSAQFTSLFKELMKAKFPVVTPDPERPILEHLVFAACLENNRYETAQGAYAALEHNFFDWNEVRVTTVRELTETLQDLTRPETTAGLVRQLLQSVFSTSYSFDLEEIRKLKLGAATERLNEIKGITPFVVSYVVQVALGGHSIPIDHATLNLLLTMELITTKNAEAATVPGMERTISKTQGFEFASMLHEMAAQYQEDHTDEELQKIILKFNPNAARFWAALQAKQESAAAAKEAKAKASQKKRTSRKKASTKSTAGNVESPESKQQPAAEPQGPASSRPAKPSKKKKASPGDAKAATSHPPKSTNAKSGKRSTKKKAVKKTPLKRSTLSSKLHETKKKVAEKNGNGDKAAADKTKSSGKSAKKKPR